MPAGITTPASSDVLGTLSTKPKESPPTLGGGNWLTVGAWNKPPTGQTLTDYNAWLNKIGVPENTFGQFMINPTAGQFSLPTNANLNAMGGINTSKPSYQTFPLYNQPSTPVEPIPTPASQIPTSLPSIMTPKTESSMKEAWLNAATRAGYNPTRMLMYYNRNRRIQ